MQHFLVLDLVDTIGTSEVLNRIVKLNKEIYISSNKEYTFLKWKSPLLSQGKVKILLPFNSISFYMMLRNDLLFLPSNVDACHVPCLISISDEQEIPIFCILITWCPGRELVTKQLVTEMVISLQVFWGTAQITWKYV